MASQVSITEDVKAALSLNDRLVVLRVEPADVQRSGAVVERLKEWSRQVDSAWGQKGQIFVDPVWAMPDGSVTVNLNKPEPAIYPDVIRSLVADLTGLGDQISISLYGPQMPLLYSQRVAVTSSVTHVSPRLSDEAARRPPGPRSDVPAIRRSDMAADILDEVLDHVLEWCRLPDANYFVVQDTVGIQTDFASRTSLLATFLRQATDVNVYLIAEDYPHRARVVIFTPAAQLLYQDIVFGEHDPVAIALTQATSILSDLAPLISVGFALRGATAGTSLSRFTVAGAWPQPDDPLIAPEDSIRMLAERWILDAFPVLYLGPNFRDTLPHELEEFTAVELGPGLLLTSRYLEDTFGRSRPSVAAMARARTELGDLMLDGSRYRALKRASRISRPTS